jgi:hypothetical protein
MAGILALEKSSTCELYPHIQRHLQGLEEIEHDSKKRSIDLLRCIEALCSQLLKVSGLEATLKSRITVVANRLLPLAQSRKLDLIDHEINQLKLGLQYEACIMGSLGDVSEFGENDHIFDMSNLIKGINILSCEPITIEDLRYLFTLYCPRYFLRGECLVIPCGHFPAVELIEAMRILQKEDPFAEILGEVLSNYYFENEELITHELPSAFNAARTDFVLDLLRTLNNSDLSALAQTRRDEKLANLQATKLSGRALKIATEEITTQYDPFFKMAPIFAIDRQFTPILLQLSDYVETALGLSKDPVACADALDTPSLLKEHALFENEELIAFYLANKEPCESSALSVFNLLCRIQNAAISKMTALPAIRVDLNYTRFQLLLNSKVQNRGLVDVYPTSLHKILCDSSLEFLRLPLHTSRQAYVNEMAYHRALGVVEVIKEEYNFDEALLAWDLEEKAKAKKEKKPKVKPLGALQDITNVANVAKENAEALGASVKKEAVVEAYAKPVFDDVSLSLKTTKQCLPKLFKIHPRIQAWLHSVERGLVFYKFDPAKAAISQEEFIKRKRLPPELLVFLFDEHFSNPSLWIHRKRQFKRRTCDVFIDGGLYRIQATINDRNSLYHFSAYPLALKHEEEERLSDEAILALESDEEVAGHFWEMPGLKGIAFDVSGNGHLDFEGRHFEILKKH